MSILAAQPAPARPATPATASGRTIVSGATVIDPSQRLNDRRDLLIENGRIAALDKSIPARPGDAVIDAKGLLLVPGLVDIHAHLREPGGSASETIESGTRAAAAGGFTTVMCMPNTNPVCDSPVVVRYIIDRAEQVGSARVAPIAAVTKGQSGEQLADLGALKGAGAMAFSDDGRPVPSAAVMRRALQYARMLDTPIFDHAEDMTLTGDGVMHEGAVSLRLGLKGIPRSSEATIVARDAALCLETGGRLHICHVSNRDSVAAIRHFKERGAPLTAEVSPHHLTLTDEAVEAGPRHALHEAYRTNAKMKPPLCEKEDRAALIEALEDGTLDCIATDHAPHFPASKDTVFDSAPFGILGFESALAVLWTAFVDTGRWKPEFLIDRLTAAPARVVRAPWGTLRTGQPADLALVQTGVRFVFDEGHLRSRSRNSPWLGDSFTARIGATLFAGREVFTSPEVFPSGVLGARAG